MNDIPPIRCPILLIQGDKDDVVAPDAVIAWGESRHSQPKVLRFPQAGHFFHGQLGELRAGLEQALQVALGLTGGDAGG